MQRDEPLRRLVEANLRAFAVHSPLADPQRAAAVALCIADEGHGADLPGLPRHAAWSTHAALVLTRRSETLAHHAGQWALPGGRIEAGESAEQAALRELAEEVGLPLEAQAVLGRLDDFVTRSGFVITPIVVWAGAAQSMTPQPGEVQSIHRIPVAEFLRPDAPWLDREDHGLHPVLRMPVGQSWIAAPTAAIVYQFCEVCFRGRPTRVAHFEQPLFAWK